MLHSFEGLTLPPCGRSELHFLSLARVSRRFLDSRRLLVQAAQCDHDVSSWNEVARLLGPPLSQTRDESRLESLHDGKQLPRPDRAALDGSDSFGTFGLFNSLVPARPPDRLTNIAGTATDGWPNPRTASCISAHRGGAR
jgi:hypothetical protein